MTSSEASMVASSEHAATEAESGQHLRKSKRGGFWGSLLGPGSHYAGFGGGSVSHWGLYNPRSETDVLPLWPATADLSEVFDHAEIERGLELLLVRGNDIARLQEESGLTWRQLASLFSVSSAALHGWVAGTSMNDTHRARLLDLKERIGRLGENTLERQSRLFEMGQSGSSFYEELRGEQYNEAEISDSWFGSLELKKEGAE